MISGARELMTPGAWEKQGATYRLSTEDSPAPDALAERRAALEQLRTKLFIHAARNEGRFPATASDLAAFWRHMGCPVVRDDAARIWVLGVGAAARSDALRSLEAPDFTLPDLEGRRHSLSDQRGKKVLLVTWASW